MYEFIVIFLNFISMISIIFLIANIFLRMDITDVSLYFVLHLFSLLLWSFMVIIEVLISFIFPNNNFAYPISYIPTFFVPVFFLLLGTVFIKNNWKFKPINLVLFLVPVISTVAVLTNNFHHLFIDFEIRDGFVNTIYGPFMYLNLIYSYFCIVMGMYYLFYYSSKKSSLFSKQTTNVIIGSSLIFSIYLFCTLIDFHPMVITSSLFFVSVVFYYFSIDRYDFLDVVPISMRSIIDPISESILVLSKNLKIVEYNEAFLRMHNISNEQKKNREKFLNTLYIKLTSTDTNLVDLINKAAETKDKVHHEMTMYSNGEKKYYSVELTPIFYNNIHRATLIVYMDVTDLKLIIEELKAKNSELELFNLKLEQKNIELDKKNVKIEDLNNILTDLANFDDLTEIHNRKFLNEFYKTELKRALSIMRYKPEKSELVYFAIAMIDIDDFRAINDKYGHLVGDYVLKEVATIINNIIFPRDILCRFGGEEFVIIFTNAEKKGIIETSKRILEGISNYNFVLSGENISSKITVSMGISFLESDYIDGYEESLLKIADDRLLEAKANGKNRIVYS